jgi:putative membrane protein
VIALSDTDRAQVEAAIAAAETRTSAQFAVAVARTSDDYALYPVLWSAAIALVVGDIVALILPAIATLWIVGLQGALFTGADLVLHWGKLRVRLVPSRVKKAHAQRLARLEFAALVERRTPDAVGLLLFVSEAERHVEILVDRGIAQRIDQAAWRQVVADFVAAISAGKVGAALIGAIDGGATLLAPHFPPRPGSATTIPDRVTEI